MKNDSTQNHQQAALPISKIGRDFCRCRHASRQGQQRAPKQQEYFADVFKHNLFHRTARLRMPFKRRNIKQTQLFISESIDYWKTRTGASIFSTRASYRGDTGSREAMAVAPLGDCFPNATTTTAATVALDAPVVGQCRFNQREEFAAGGCH